MAVNATHEISRFLWNDLSNCFAFCIEPALNIFSLSYSVFQTERNSLGDDAAFGKLEKTAV